MKDASPWKGDASEGVRHVSPATGNLEINTPLAAFYRLERISATLPEIASVSGEVHAALSALNIPPHQLRERDIALAVGSRGIAKLREIVHATVQWLRAAGARPFAFPAMGSHGGATAEGQRQVLAEYGVTPENIGCPIRSDMATVITGTTPHGDRVFMDRNAWHSDGVVAINRVKPHTDFYGRIESGLTKMIAIGMGKADGARECHRAIRKYGNEQAIRAAAQVSLATGKILAGLAVVENELHQIAAIRAVRHENLFAVEEETLQLARRLVARLPFTQLDLLIVDEMGKNVSGTGMDTKVIGRGIRLPKQKPADVPAISLIYVRDLTDESDGNALGVGLADLVHQRLYRKIRLEETYVNVQTSLNLPVARVPMHVGSDREAFDLALAALGSPAPSEQRLVWIRNTLELDHLFASEPLLRDREALAGWRLAPELRAPVFDGCGNVVSWA